MPGFGFAKVQRKLYDLGLRKYVDEALPYKVVRGSWKGTLEADGMEVLKHTVASGKQLKLLFLRVWSEYTGTTVFKITQANGSVGSAPDGTVDYPMLEAAGSEVIGPVPLESPIHVLEGDVTVSIQEPTSAEAGASKFGVAFWGVEETSPRPRTVK